MAYYELYMREPFDSRAYYHVYNRGVDKRVLFSDQWDFRRFCESLYLFNDTNYKHKGGRVIQRDIPLAGHELFTFDRDPLVSIVAYCLVPNHFHMLLRQKEPNGISKFLHRVGMGYAKYFNKRYNREGRLFESPFKAKPVDLKEHLQLLPRYIHLNALDGTNIQWRAGQKTDWKKAKVLLNNFTWSSHKAYAGLKSFLPIVDEEVAKEWFPTKEVYWKYLMTPTNMEEELTFTKMM